MVSPTKSLFYYTLFSAGKWAHRNRNGLFRVAVIFMIFLAVPRLAYQRWRLLADTGSNGALDLKMFS